MTEREPAEEYLEGYAEILAGVCATRRRLTREEREALGSLGERAAEAGIGLRMPRRLPHPQQRSRQVASILDSHSGKAIRFSGPFGPFR